MTQWAGLVMFALGAWLLASAAARWRRGRVAPVRADLAGFGTMMRGIILGALLLVGIKMGLMYWAFGGDGLFSGLNLAGLEFLLASYGAWVFVSLAPPKQHEQPASPHELETAS